MLGDSRPREIVPSRWARGFISNGKIYRTETKRELYFVQQTRWLTGALIFVHT